MKLEPNMYVRTNEGKITKIIEIDKDGFERFDEFVDFTNYEITKASYNIIDLIEVGDYVNGQVVTQIIPNNRKIEPSSMIYTGTNYFVGLYNEQIETIVTKEQFSQMEYKIGGNE